MSKGQLGFDLSAEPSAIAREEECQAATLLKDEAGTRIPEPSPLPAYSNSTTPSTSLPLEEPPPPPRPPPIHRSSSSSTHPRTKSLAVVIPPSLLKPGVEMLKVSAKSAKKFKSKTVWIDRGPVTEELGLKGTNVGAGNDLDVRICWEKGGVGGKRETHIPISTIRDLRFGSNGAPYRTSLHLSPDVEPRWLTIIYVVPSSSSSFSASPLALLNPSTPSYKLVHFIAPSEEVLKMWKAVLEKIRETRSAMGLTPNLIQGGDPESDADSDTERRIVKVEEVQKLCGRLGMGLGREEITQAFQKTAAPKDFLDFKAFQKFVKLLKRREDLVQLFQDLIGDESDSMSLECWRSFLRRDQECTVSDETINAWYIKYADPLSGTINWEGFVSFVVSSNNHAVKDDSNQDMTRPLTDYYINSSHNTYLMGNQIQGESHVEGYIRALQQGCRCVELDVWDGDDDLPIITHGHTFTSKILASDALAAIAQYAFLSSTYPLILSLEIHCDTNQQDKLAEILVEKLGERLVRERIDGSGNDEPIKRLPSPEQLRGRILLKAKNLFIAANSNKPSESNLSTSNEIDSSTETSSSSDSSDLSLRRAFNRVRKSFDDRRPSYLSRGHPTKHRLPRTPSPMRAGSLEYQPSIDSTLSSSSTPPTSISPSNSISASTAATTTSSSKRPMSHSLASLLIYTIGVKARGFNKKESYDPTHVLSFGENKLLKMAKEETMRQDFISHNRGHLTRSYPRGWRVTSTNYLPNLLWGLGVQMVAVNWQTFDTGMQLNNAMFYRAGRSGYVLKPPILREKGPLKDKEALIQTANYVLDLEIVSAQQLPRTKESIASATSSSPSSSTFATSSSATSNPTTSSTSPHPHPHQHPHPHHHHTLDSIPPPMDPFVEVTLYLPGLSNPIKRRTRVISCVSSVSPSSYPNFNTNTLSTPDRNSGNAFNPIFHSTFSIPFTILPSEGFLDLVFLGLNVLDAKGNLKAATEDGKGDFVGAFVVGLGSLLPGYRHLPLYDSIGDQHLYSSIFIKSKVTLSR